MNFECPHCTELIEAEPEFAGTKGKCPHCQKKILVPNQPVSRLIQCPDCGGVVSIQAHACPHCGRSRAGKSSISESTKPSDALGIILLLLPLGSAVLMWFWVSSMNLLQNPFSTLIFLVTGTILITATLMAVEASQLGMGAIVKGKRTSGPVEWFICAILLWILAYPAYLYSRSRYGATNYIVGGLVSAFVFLGVAYTLKGAIESQEANVKRSFEELQNELRK